MSYIINMPMIPLPGLSSSQIAENIMLFLLVFVILQENTICHILVLTVVKL